MSFANEVKIHFFAFCFFALFLELFLLLKGEDYDLSKDYISLLVFAFFFVFSFLEYIFRLFVNGYGAAFCALLPGLFLYVLLKDTIEIPYIEAAFIIAACLRILFVFIPYKKYVLAYGSFFLDVAYLILFFGYHRFAADFISDKFLIIFLVLLSLSAIKKEFPFYFFIMLGVVLFFLPVKSEPLDWSGVVRMGERIAEKVSDISYYLNINWGDDAYTTGYNSFYVTGGEVRKEEKTQLVLKMDEKPYRIFKDETTDKNMKVRKNVYLSGGLGGDKKQLVQFMQFLFDKDVDRDMAALFSHKADIDIEYGYINTNDEIAPINSFKLKSGKEEIEDGTSKRNHKKGYKLRAYYIDVDYGSPYLIELLRSSYEMLGKEYMSYEEICDYSKTLYDLDLKEIISDVEYRIIVEELMNVNRDISEGSEDSIYADFCDTTGSTDKMRDLAYELTKDVTNDYDKCRIIEAYLRQYQYSTSALGGHDPGSDMSTPSGMADIADRFLFETGEGYCVQYTSAMVMLLRLSGIPARAVFGYRYDFPFEQQDKYEVSSNLAHAWPQAYLQGIGWISFEPTAFYFTALDYTWRRKAKEASEDENSLENELSAIPKAVVENGLENAADDNELSLAEGRVNAIRTTRQIIMIVVLVGLSIALLIVLLIFGGYAAWQLRYRFGTPNDRLRMDVERIKKNIMKRSEEKFEDRGLLSDFTARAPMEMKQDVQRVFEVYYRMIYRQSAYNSPSASENELAKTLRCQLQKKR